MGNAMRRNIVNPFICNGYEGPLYFCDREKETEELCSTLKNGRNITLVSPRRMGKTGLIWHTFHHIRSTNRDAVCVYLDIFPTKNQSEFVRMLGEAIATEAFTKGMLLKKKAMELLAALRPVLGMDPMTGTPLVSLNVDATPSEANLRSIFGFLNKLQREVYVAIDEFQQVASYPEPGTEALLRSFMQFSQNVHFIFSGSRQHLMTEMFVSPQRPFYQSTELMHLSPLDEEAYYQFANNFFEKRQGGFDRQLFHDLYAAFDGYTWYIQTLLNRLYEHFRSVSKSEQLGTTLSAVVGSKSAYYESLMQFLTGNQFSLLRAIAKEERVVQPMGKKFVGKYRLPSNSSILAALKVLEEKELIYKQKDGYMVYDRFLNLWLKRL